MKLLVVGDFHGEFSKKIPQIINKEKIDLVVSLGDYPPFHYRKLWFKHCYGKDTELWKVIGKKKYKELILKDLRLAEISLKGLNELPVPVYTILGNIDYPSADDIADLDKSKINNNKKMPGQDIKEKLVNRLKKYKNIKRFDYKALKFGDYVFIGMRGHSSPGKVQSKAYRKHKRILDNLLHKFRKKIKKEKLFLFLTISPTIQN